MSTALTSPREGELLLVRLRVESRVLEEVLDALAALPFPVNPDLQHAGIFSFVEFPAFSTRISDVEKAVEPFDLTVRTVPMLDAIRS